jgi:hypothetical protein
LKGKIADRLLLAAIAGSAGAVAANLFLYILNLFLPGRTVNMPQLTLEIFLNIGSYTFFQRALGFSWSLVIGGTYAFIYIMILDFTGWRILWLKAVIVVSVTWIFMAGFMMRLLALATETRDNPPAIGAFFLAHLFFATVVAFIVSKTAWQGAPVSTCPNPGSAGKRYRLKTPAKISVRTDRNRFIKPKKPD